MRASMFPPQSTVPTFRPWKRSGPARMAANPAAARAPPFGPGKASGAAKRAGNPRRTRPFDHQLLFSNEGVYRALQAFLADEDDIVHQFTDDFPRDVARRFDGDAFRDSGPGA